MVNYLSEFKKDAGFTLMEVLVGIFLMALLFWGIFGAYRLIAKVIQRSERKITAIAIANQQMEQLRDLPYLETGTKEAELPYAQGILSQSTTTERNGITYNLETRVKLISDSADELDEDQCDWDYKRVQITASWSDDQVELITDIMPTNKAEEIAVCQNQPGGILSVYSPGDSVSSPLIQVFDPESGDLASSYWPSDGEYDFPLAASDYKVVVSKDGYSTSSSYGTEEIDQPYKLNPTVGVNQVQDYPYEIEKLSTLAVETYSNWSVEYWLDSFEDQTKISDISGLEVDNDQVQLATSSDSGYLTSTEVVPSRIDEWKQVEWNDVEPSQTDLAYQVYYATSTDWNLVSDFHLPGNSVGFDSSPVDISDLDINDYPKLKVKGTASSSTTTSPVLEDWQISWISSGGNLIPNTSFHVEGNPIGKDADNQIIYECSATTTSDSNGQVDLYPIEPDSEFYHFSSAESDLNLATTSPAQVEVAPDSVINVDLFFEAQNSLLVTVKNARTLNPILGASTTLADAQYSKTKYTDEEGQVHFVPLEQDTYDLSVSAPGCNSTSTSVSVSGNQTKVIKLIQVE